MVRLQIHTAIAGIAMDNVLSSNEDGVLIPLLRSEEAFQSLAISTDMQ